MKSVVMFRTTDGKTFESKAAAQTHEVEQCAIAEMTNILRPSIQTGRTESVIRQILEDSPKVLAILANYRKKLPKTQKTA